MREYEQAENTYDRYPEIIQFWASVDLVSSSNYRLEHGPRQGYVRGETFFSLISTVIASCPEIRLLKEMGDAVLLSADTFRPLLESLILIEQTAQQLSRILTAERYPFSVRSAVDFGPAKRLIRRGEDFLGIPLDRLSRLMRVRHENSSIVLHEDLMSFSEDILLEYQSFLTVGNPQTLSAELTKGMTRLVQYRHLFIDRDRLAEFENFFVPWKGLPNHIANAR
jgi:hypothetical protein